MVKLGSEKRPVIVHVKTEERAHAITPRGFRYRV
jgi:hypothetical protein